MTRPKQDPLARRPPRSNQVIAHPFSSRDALKVLTPATDGKGKKVAKKPDKGNKGRQKSQSTATDSKGKRKAPPDGDDTDTIESTSDVVTKPTKSKAQKRNQTKAKEPRPTEAEVDADDAAEPKRKKMKKLNVNIFGSAKPDSLDWANQFNLVSRIATQVLVLLCRGDW